MVNVKDRVDEKSTEYIKSLKPTDKDLINSRHAANLNFDITSLNEQALFKVNPFSAINFSLSPDAQTYEVFTGQNRMKDLFNNHSSKMTPQGFMSSISAYNEPLPYMPGHFAKGLVGKGIDYYHGTLRDKFPILNHKLNPLNFATNNLFGTHILSDATELDNINNEIKKIRSGEKKVAEEDVINLHKYREDLLKKTMKNDLYMKGISILNPHKMIGAKVEDAVDDKLLDLALSGFKERAKNSNSQALKNAVKAIEFSGDRIFGADATKLGVLDAVNLVNPLTYGFAAGLGKLSKIALKRGMMGVLGVQDFYHATKPENVPKIVEHGLNRSLGATEGGATRKIVSDSYISNPSYPTHQNAYLSTTDTKLEVPTEKFIDNAIGNSYVGKGLTGNAAVGIYSHKLQEDRVSNAIADVKSIPDEIKSAKGIKAKLTKIKEAPSKLFEPYNIIYSKKPGEASIVAGAMPYGKFQDKFMQDPDGVTYFGSDYVTKSPEGIERKHLLDKSFTMSNEELNKHIENELSKYPEGSLTSIGGVARESEKEILRAGELGFKDIWQARTPIKEYGKFLASEGGALHALRGLGYLGGAGYAGYKAVDIGTKPVRSFTKKVKGDSQRISEYIKSKKKKVLEAEKPLLNETVETATQEAKKINPELIEKVLAKKLPIGAAVAGLGLGYLGYNMAKDNNK